MHKNLVPYLQNLVQLFLVLHDKDVGLAVTGNEVTCLWGVGSVDTSRETTSGELRGGGEVNDKIT